ncbi:GNAT family N-acetyltransferase [Streptomyces alkaliterrae]|uniref:GNAT family N-acetyltransferase n=1 Tax=Streptomyces alkaliterrae TaxID=2213162 RepID=A0A5P0YWW9_9ACTN|nr:GNAT family N-acetyltransferase [Streptomyces alkaliterrae]MBB1252520.1 GNAT family N-acetyltransferase [Streptomyces alkaliterrae]MBB1261097.1 GNAT family N-acetyltransferase [Streptomyces alkaliterrae]MQS02989.1 GNAT family N-acetyltransferase [Streptomyces alkaliterrae]
MPELERLRRDHAAALLTFERENRAYFAATVPDRGDDYFAEFDARHEALLTEQDCGLHHFHVIVTGDGDILGRVNLVDVTPDGPDRSAELGFRVGRAAAGRGLATRAVRRVCELAAGDYGLTSLRAAATLDNVASRTVLERTGFTVTGETTLMDQPALTYTRPLKPAAVER